MRVLTCLMLCAFVPSTYASQTEDALPDQWPALHASYIVHSEGASYPEPPTKTDRAITLHFDGKPAKEVFDLIGPDAKVKCSSEARDRERRKKGVSCIYTAQLNDPKDSHYTCWIGIDLRTGEGDVRVSC